MFFVPILSAILFYYALFYYALFFSFLLFQDDTIVRSFLCPLSFALFLRPVPLPCLFLLFQDDSIVRSFLSLCPPFVLLLRSFPLLRSPPALCIRQDWRIGRRLRSSLSSPFSIRSLRRLMKRRSLPLPSLSLCALFAHRCANLLFPFRGEPEGAFFIFHFCRIFAAVFPRLVPFFLFLLLQANSICRPSLSLCVGIRSRKNTPQIPFPPRKSHYSDFSKPQNLHISKKMRTFAPDFRTTSHPLTLSPTNPLQGLCQRPDTEWIETGKEVS